MHVFLTGASSGIGEALAYAFAEAGYDLTLVARRQEALERVATTVRSTHDRKVEVIPYDLSDLAGISSLVDRAQEGIGPIDVLVNNAGVQVLGPTHECDIEWTEKLMTVNVLAPFRLTRLVLPGMVERSAGVIIDIASLAALAPTPGMYHYSASKAALAAASECLRAEAKRYGVHVVTVYPGPVKTDMADKAVASYDRPMANRMPVGNTSGLAKRILKAVVKRRKRVIYPRVYAVTRWFPNATRIVMDAFAPIPNSGGTH